MQEKKDLNIPHDILSDENLNPHQRLIVSALSEEPRMFYGEIAKRICTERKDVKKELGELVNLKVVHVSNGDQRPEYSLITGLGFIGNKTEIHGQGFEKREKEEKERSKEKEEREKKSRFSIEKRHVASSKAVENAKDKLFLTDIEDKITLAFSYWINNGGIRHKYGSGEYKSSIQSLRNVFEGVMFRNVPDSNIHSPLLNKTKTFEVEDWYTSIDNFNVAVVDSAYEPKNKNIIRKQRKDSPLWRYIYNPYSGSIKKSLFLQYLEPLKLAQSVESNFPELHKILSTAYKNYNLQEPDSPDFLTVASNKFGEIIKTCRENEDHLWDMYKESKMQVCELFMDYLLDEIKDFHFKMLTSKWLYDTRLRNWLSKKGVIS